MKMEALINVTSVPNAGTIQDSQPHYLAYSHAVGGLGNNLLGLVSAYAIAAILNYTLVCSHSIVSST